VYFQLYNPSVTRQYANRDPEEEAVRAFRLFVGDESSGKIGLRSLRRVCKEIGQNIGDEELQAMIDEFDEDQDGYCTPLYIFLYIFAL